MRPIPVLSFSAISALGRGLDETTRALRGGRTGLRVGSAVLPEAAWPVGEVRGDLPAVPETLADRDTRAHRLVAAVLADLAAPLAALREAFPADRIAVVAGTSASGNTDLERALSAGDGTFDYHRRQSFGSAAAFARRMAGARGPAWSVSTACSSGANAMVSAAALLESGACDAAIVVAVDALCRTTYHGFKGLGVMDDQPCRPFDASRKGMSLGEGAAALLLARDRPAAFRDGPDLVFAGWGAGSEAYHMTSPDPEGDGAARVMAAAIERAGLRPGDVGYVNLHGTGTPQNDASESKGVAKVLGTDVPCSSTKGYTGHLLGAAAGIEAVITLLALRDGLLPRNLHLSDPDPEVAIRVLRDDLAAPDARWAVSNSFAFGGNDAALVFGVRP